MSPTRSKLRQLLAGRSNGQAPIFWFDASRYSPRSARRSVADAISDLNLPAEVRDTIAILVSELVTNAWMHADSPVAVEVAKTGGAVIVVVHDESTRLPRFPTVSIDEASGRGLTLVDRLADRWGVERSERTGGKAIWFEVQATRDPLVAGA